MSWLWRWLSSMRRYRSRISKGRTATKVNRAFGWGREGPEAESSIMTCCVMCCASHLKSRLHNDSSLFRCCFVVCAMSSSRSTAINQYDDMERRKKSSNGGQKSSFGLSPAFDSNFIFRIESKHKKKFSLRPHLMETSKPFSFFPFPPSSEVSFAFF